VISKIKAIMTPGGLAVLSLPNAKSFPYLVSRASHSLRRAARTDVFDRHVSYPASPTVRLSDSNVTRVIQHERTHLFGPRQTARLAYGPRVFLMLKRLTFSLSRLWALRYLSQLFYVVVRNGRSTN
jgi:hypothetical protein